MSLRKPSMPPPARRERLVLRFNATVGRDPLPRIRELASDLRLEIAEASPTGRRHREISVRGDLAALLALERELLRIPSITVRRRDDTT